MELVFSSVWFFILTSQKATKAASVSHSQRFCLDHNRRGCFREFLCHNAAMLFPGETQSHTHTHTHTNTQTQLPTLFTLNLGFSSGVKIFSYSVCQPLNLCELHHWTCDVNSQVSNFHTSCFCSYDIMKNTLITLSVCFNVSCRSFFKSRFFL